jgi:PAS domain S-box-containing protein
MRRDNKMANANILVVEDEGIVAMDIQNRLKNLGYDIPAIVFSGKEAIKKAEETRPDLVLMDIRLKGDVDGIEAAEQIRARFDIPVVYLTALTDEDTLQRAKVTEPYGYIMKPFEERELHSTIETALYKHEMESKLKESERWLATTLRSIGDAVMATDKKGLITLMNPVAEALTGWKQEETLGKDLTEVFNIINEQTRTLTESPVTRVIREGVVVGLANHSMLIAKDGREIPIDDSAAPIRDGKGNITGVVLVFRDISERKRAEKLRTVPYKIADAAIKSTSLKDLFQFIHTELSTIIDTRNFYIALYDADKELLSFPYYVDENYPEESSFSTRPPRKAGKGLTEYVIKTGKALLATDNSIKELAEKGEIEIIGPLSLSWLGVPLRVEEKTVGVIAVQSYTNSSSYTKDDLELLEFVSGQIAVVIERTRAEHELVEKQKYLRALFESVADAVVSLDNENKIVEWNKAAEKMFGYRKDEVMGKNIDDIIAPDGKHGEAVSITKQILSSKEIVGFETTRYKKDGTPIEVMISGAPIIADDKVTGGVAVYKDITTKKELERQREEAAQILEKKVTERTKELKQAYEQLKRTQEELVRKERLAVLGQLAGGVGHELRNPLGVINNAAYFLNMKLGNAEDKVRKHLGIIDREVFAANEIITNLLAFARVKPPKRVNVDIDKLIKEVLAKSYIPPNIKIVIEIPEDIPLVRVDPGQIERVLLNIITNAAQAMHEGGELKIRGEGVNGFVSIDVSDNGEGIPKEVMSKMFQPLFTTKTKGIGLGLTVCKSLLEENGGKISVKSKLSKGTTVSVKLPLNHGGN